MPPICEEPLLKDRCKAHSPETPRRRPTAVGGGILVLAAVWLFLYVGIPPTMHVVIQFTEGPVLPDAGPPSPQVTLLHHTSFLVRELLTGENISSHAAFLQCERVLQPMCALRVFASGRSLTEAADRLDWFLTESRERLRRWEQSRHAEALAACRQRKASATRRLQQIDEEVQAFYQVQKIVSLPEALAEVDRLRRRDAAEIEFVDVQSSVDRQELARVKRKLERGALPRRGRKESRAAFEARRAAFRRFERDWQQKRARLEDRLAVLDTRRIYLRRMMNQHQKDMERLSTEKEWYDTQMQRKRLAMQELGILLNQEALLVTRDGAAAGEPFVILEGPGRARGIWQTLRHFHYLVFPTGVCVMLLSFFLWSGRRPRLSHPLFDHRLPGVPIRGLLPDVEEEAWEEGMLTGTLPFLHAFADVAAEMVRGAGEGGLRSFAFLGASPGVGVSALVLRLGTVLAQSGRRVLLVEADHMQPSLHHFFDHDGFPGLTDLILDQLDPVEVIVATDIAGLDLLPAGLRMPASCRSSTIDALQRTWERLLTTTYDFIFLDGAPAASDQPGFFVTHADRVLVVAGVGYSAESDILRAVGKITRSGGALGGVLYNRVPIHQIPGGADSWEPVREAS